MALQKILNSMDEDQILALRKNGISTKGDHGARVFDEWPELVSGKEKELLLKSFSKICAKCKPAQSDLKDKSIEDQINECKQKLDRDPKIKESLDKWMLALITKGVDELLDQEQLAIKEDFKILSWPLLSLVAENERPRIITLVSSFVFCITHVIQGALIDQKHFEVTDPGLIVALEYMDKARRVLVTKNLEQLAPSNYDSVLAKQISKDYEAKVSKATGSNVNKLLEELDTKYKKYIKIGLSEDGKAISTLQTYRNVLTRKSSFLSQRPSQVGYFKSQDKSQSPQLSPELAPKKPHP